MEERIASVRESVLKGRLKDEGHLLVPKDFSPEVDTKSVTVLNSAADADNVPCNAVVDVRPINQKGLYVSRRR